MCVPGPGGRGTYWGEGYLLGEFLVPGGLLVPGGYLLGGVPGPGVYLVQGGVPGPGGCTWSQGGVPGPGGVPAGGISPGTPPCEQNDKQV